MNGVGVLGHQPLPCTASAHSFEATRQTFNCQHCNVTLKGKIQYEAHISSRRHKKTVASQKKKARRTKPFSTSASIIGIPKVSVIEYLVGRPLFASVFTYIVETILDVCEHMYIVFCRFDQSQLSFFA